MADELVDKVYEAADLLGWDGEKDEKGRQFLSDLKDMSTEKYNGPMRYMESQINIYLLKPYIAFFMIREPEEIQKFCDKIKNTTTLLIRRPNTKQFKNHADINVLNYPYDYLIHNCGSLLDLKKEANTFIQKIMNFTYRI